MNRFPIQEKIVTPELFLELKKSWADKKVVFTNGCFDVLHLGHVQYLLQARELGDCLVVGLNSDQSVKRLKGENRPINPEHARATLLAALQFVDYVILFDQDTPQQLITKIIPNILVKGSDYAVENIVGADIVMAHGGKVCTIDFVEGFSSSNIINQINN
jgi:rfaE bifunctional protein nucleotidyltransferase chain/domain